MINLPPMPKLDDFMFADLVHRAQYSEALSAWERVCNKIIEASVANIISEVKK